MDAQTRATFDEVARTFKASLRAAQRLEAAIANSREDIHELREEVAALGATVTALTRDLVLLRKEHGIMPPEIRL